MTRLFKTKDLRRLHKAGQISSYWSEIYQMRYEKRLANDLFKEHISGWLLRIVVVIMLGTFVVVPLLVQREAGFMITVSIISTMLFCLLAWFLLAGADDRLRRFVDDISLIAEWSNSGPADVLGIPEPRILSLATGIISKAAAELLLSEANASEPRMRPRLHYRSLHGFATAFNARYDLFERLALLSVSDWSVNLAAGQRLIDAGLYPPPPKP